MIMALHIERKATIWQGALILTIAGIITKILSAVYRIPYQNLAGDIGFYIYQQVYPFYGIALMLSTYTFPMIVSKLLAERYEIDDQEGVRKVLLTSFLFFLIFGLFGFCSLYFGAYQLASFMGDVKLAPLLKIISFCFLLLPLISILRGYFQGQNNMKPTAISQVIEQFVRVITIILSTFLLLSNGYTVYTAASGAVFGSITGGFCAIFVLVAYWWMSQRKKRKSHKVYSNIQMRSILKTLLIEGMMICISGMLLILMQLVDSLSLYSMLVQSGMDDTQAKIAKGVYDRGQPLIQLGTVVATSLSLSLVPLISSAKVRGDLLFIQEKIHLALRVSMVVGVGASLGLACIMRPTNMMLFEDSQGTMILIVLAFSILFTTFILTISSILQGLGFMGVPAIIVLGGMMIKWGLNVLFIPIFHEMGAAVASIVAYGCMAVLLTFYLKTKQSIHIPFYSVISKIGLAALIMVLALLGLFVLINNLFIHFQSNRIFATIQALGGVMVGGISYLFVIIKANVFTPKEISLLPYGDKLFERLQKQEKNTIGSINYKKVGGRDETD